MKFDQVMPDQFYAERLFRSTSFRPGGGAVVTGASVGPVIGVSVVVVVVTDGAEVEAAGVRLSISSFSFTLIAATKFYTENVSNY